MSPALFADAFAATAIDGYYHLLDVDRLPERRLPQLLEAIKVTGFAGANVTYPFKQEIIPLLDAVDPEAAEVGAVNTVSIAPDGRTTGYNFDRRGWRNSFLEVLGSDSAKGKTVVQIGAGGAGRAVAFALMDLGVAGLIIHDLDSGVPMHSKSSFCHSTVHRVAALPATSNTTSRLPMASSTPLKWACAAFPAVQFRSRPLKPRIGPPTSSTRQCKRHFLALQPQLVRACSTAVECVCIRRSQHFSA
jgi:shikimate dehydrogenase